MVGHVDVDKPQWFTHKGGRDTPEASDYKYDNAFFDKHVLGMLPESLKSSLKKVDKEVNTFDTGSNSFKPTHFYDELFLLSLKEMGAKDTVFYKTEGEVYKYYEEGFDDETKGNSLRVKEQVAGFDSRARTSGLTENVAGDIDGEFNGTYIGNLKSTYAGYASNFGEDHGANYWTRSPYMVEAESLNLNDRAHAVYGTGGYGFEYTALSSLSVAPAFCL